MFGAVISSGFADIFKSNCYQNGLLPVELSAAEVAHVMASAQSEGGCRLTVDLEAQEATALKRIDRECSAPAILVPYLLGLQVDREPAPSLALCRSHDVSDFRC